MDQLLLTLTGWLFSLAGALLTNLVPRAQRWKEIQSGWNASTSGAVVYVAWGMGIALAAVITFAILSARRESAKRKVREQVYFERKAVDKELDKKHINLLSTVLQQAGLEQPYRILDSYDIFQHVVMRYEKKQNFSEQEHQHFHETVDEIKLKLGFNKVEETIQLGSTEEVHKGQPVKISLEKEGQMYEYFSTVTDNDDDELVLDGANIDYDYMPINMQTQIHIQFYRESDASYNFITNLRAPVNRQTGQLCLKHPAKLNRVQARSFSRMDVAFRFSFYALAKDKFNQIEIDRNLEYLERLPVYMGESVDFSGGGLALKSRKKVNKGDFLFLNFQMLSDEHTEPVLAAVVWSGMDKAGKDRMVRAKFYNINDKTQDQLMKFVYQMQRKAARRMKFAPKR